MRTRTPWTALILLAMSAGLVSAADLTGKWKAEFMTYYGQSPREVGETIFTFKHNGEELTGTVKGTALKETQIREGKVSGEKVSFILIRNFGGRERKMTYTGTIEGDEIRFETSIEGFGRGVRMVAKKIS